MNLGFPILLLCPLFYACPMWDPAPDYPECMNNFVCFAYAPESSDSIKVELFSEDSLIDSETHSEIVRIPNSKEKFSETVDVQISVFCNKKWYRGKRITLHIRKSSTTILNASQYEKRGINVFDEAFNESCPELLNYRAVSFVKNSYYCE